MLALTPYSFPALLLFWLVFCSAVLLQYFVDVIMRNMNIFFCKHKLQVYRSKGMLISDAGHGISLLLRHWLWLSSAAQQPWLFFIRYFAKTRLACLAVMPCGFAICPVLNSLILASFTIHCIFFWFSFFVTSIGQKSLFSRKTLIRDNALLFLRQKVFMLFPAIVFWFECRLQNAKNLPKEGLRG